MNVGHVIFKNGLIRATFHAHRTRKSGRYAAFVSQVLGQSGLSFIMSATPVGTVIPAVLKTLVRITAAIRP